MSNQSERRILFKLNRRYPMWIATAGLFYIYVLQYPLNNFFFNAGSGNYYQPQDWFVAYGFVIISSLIFLSFLYIGMMGKGIKIDHRFNFKNENNRRISFSFVLVLFGLFFFWSYSMMVLNIGMTIFSDFDTLPYRLTGILTYGRLIIQPLILSIVAYQYATSNKKWVVFLLILLLGAWACATSGSRFISILFSFPILLLIRDNKKYIIFALVLTSFITISSATRAFLLPYVLDWRVAADYIQIYSNQETKDEILDNLFMVPFSYVIMRPMGMGEVMTTLAYGQVAGSVKSAFLSFVAYFLYFMDENYVFSTKAILGIDEENIGGYSLDMFSNYWIFSGGSWLFYTLSLAIIAFMLGKSYRLFSIALERFGYRKVHIIIFVGLFLFAMDLRGSRLSLILILAWLISRKITYDFVVAFSNSLVRIYHRLLR